MGRLAADHQAVHYVEISTQKGTVTISIRDRPHGQPATVEQIIRVFQGSGDTPSFETLQKAATYANQYAHQQRAGFDHHAIYEDWFSALRSGEISVGMNRSPVIYRPIDSEKAQQLQHLQGLVEEAQGERDALHQDLENKLAEIQTLEASQEKDQATIQELLQVLEKYQTIARTMQAQLEEMTESNSSISSS
jgi:hypothetical protein